MSLLYMVTTYNLTKLTPRKGMKRLNKPYLLPWLYVIVFSHHSESFGGGNLSKQPSQNKEKVTTSPKKVTPNSSEVAEFIYPKSTNMKLKPLAISVCFTYCRYSILFRTAEKRSRHQFFPAPNILSPQ